MYYLFRGKIEALKIGCRLPLYGDTKPFKYVCEGKRGISKCDSTYDLN